MNTLLDTRDSLSFDVEKVRKDFPILQQEINGYPLVYLDNGATTQKPKVVIDAISDYYCSYNSNVHRGAHSLSDRATTAFESARKVVAEFVASPSAEQIIWTRGTTEAINLVAYSWSQIGLKAGQVILVSELEHHSNIVPWQLVAEAKGAKVQPIPVLANGEIDLDAYSELLKQDVAMVAVNHVSNALGTVNPVEQIIAMAKGAGALTLIDGAQSIAHFPVDVQALACDFYVFSGHKVFGPTGIGVLWARAELLDQMPPYQGGGEMIDRVSFAGTTFNQAPYKFEAGTPDIAGAIGLAAALEYLNQLDRKAVQEHENSVLAYCIAKGEAFGLERIGCAKEAAGAYSFLIKGAHPADVGMLLDQQGVAVRTGHHCAQPLMSRFDIPGTVRASFSIYNTQEDVDRLFAALEKAKSFLL